MSKNMTRNFPSGCFETRALACHLSPGSGADTFLDVSCSLFSCANQEDSKALRRRIRLVATFSLGEDEISGELLPSDQLHHCRALQKDLPNV